MENGTNAAQAPLYNPRWFIWTIVFLLVSGVSLVSYILISGSGIDEDSYVIQAPTQTVRK